MLGWTSPEPLRDLVAYSGVESTNRREVRTYPWGAQMLKSWRGVSHFVVIALLGCGFEKVTAPPESADAELLVSAPILRASLPGGADSSGSVVFVSAMPQAVPGAVQALVQSKDGQLATIVMHDGGFDPVALAAASGDVVTVTLTDGSGGTTSEELAVRSGFVLLTFD